MNRTRTNDRFARTRNGSTTPGKNGKRFGASSSNRSGGPVRSNGPSRRSAALQGEFALPKTIAPALPAAAGSAGLDMPTELLATLGSQGVTVLFPIRAATLPNSLAGRGRTGSGKTPAFGFGPALPARTAGQRAEARQPPELVLAPPREPAQQGGAISYSVAVDLTPLRMTHPERLRVHSRVSPARGRPQLRALPQGAPCTPQPARPAHCVRTGR